MERTIGVDIGGTRTRVAAVHNGRILARRAFQTRGIEDVEIAIREVVAEVEWAQPAAIGVGAPAPMNLREGQMLACPNLPAWNGVKVREILERAFRCPIDLANDATCAAIGELAFGSRSRDFVYVTWSTGIGGGIVTGGQVVWGATGGAAEIGHIVLKPEGPRCACGRNGCLEAIAGGASLARLGTEVLRVPVTAREVVERAQSGDPVSHGLVENACRAMGQAIVILWSVLEPELIVLGGGLTGSWPYLGPQVLTAVQGMIREKPRLELTQLGDDAGLLGAAALSAHMPANWRSP